MISRVFIDRPRLAGVVSIVLMLAGILSITSLPITQYPQVTPPQIVVRASYPGASAEVMADIVAGPIEDAVNGVQDMIYMSSNSTNNGAFSFTIDLGSIADGQFIFSLKSSNEAQLVSIVSRTNIINNSAPAIRQTNIAAGSVTTGTNAYIGFATNTEGVDLQ